MLVGIAQMWNRLSLRKRLMLPLGAMFLAALLVGAISLYLFTTTQLIEENEPWTRTTRLIAEALNSALRSSNNPEQTLDAFGQVLGTSEAVQFRRTGTELSLDVPVVVRPPFESVPGWFIKLIDVPEIGDSFPVMIGDSHVADIVFAPDLSADLYETWIRFLAIAIFRRQPGRADGSDSLLSGGGGA